MPGRTYSVVGEAVTLGESGSPQTLVFINPATNGPGSMLCVTRAWVSQKGSVVSAQQDVALGYQTSAFPTLTSVTPQPHDPNGGASGIVGATNGAAGTCGINATAEGGGTKVPIIADNFNILNPWWYIPTEAERLWFGIQGTAQGISLWLPTLPGITTGWSFGIIYIEF